ncbi:MAG: TIGR03621 family F420-dependent LLM class oxidoreductase [Kineosporiaceae bacterium]
MERLGFGVNVREVESTGRLRSLVRRADELGYDVLALPDHLGGPAPFATLAAAALVSERLRLRTYVLNAGFWNAALLAREVATVDALSDGRVELGVGAGHMQHEHEDARLPWLPFRERVAVMAELVDEVRSRLADPDHRPRPVQDPVPVVVGAMSEAALAVAARVADVVAFAGARQVAGEPPGTFTLASAGETLERVREVRRLAGGRPYRSDVLLQVVDVGRPPEESAAEIAAGIPGLTVADVLDNPFLLLAPDPAAGARELLRRREVYGFDQFSTHEANLDPLGQVIAALP